MNDQLSIQWWLADLRAHFVDNDPALLRLYETYASEALFGRQFIETDLKFIKRGSKILEVGAGSLLLSCQLVREGFKVTALEPISTGFSHFLQMREIVLARAATLECTPVCLDITAENLTEIKSFDYAFSINVMEHVNDVPKAITNIANSLKDGSIYHFTSPNYLFPYEPHFNLPTLFSKHLTAYVFGRKILSNKKMSCPLEVWQSLNWINSIQIRKICRRLSEFEMSFNRRFLVTTVERIASDPIFAHRRSPLIRKFLLLLIKFRIHYLFRFLPVGFQPNLDCRLQRNSFSKGY